MGQIFVAVLAGVCSKAMAVEWLGNLSDEVTQGQSNVSIKEEWVHSFLTWIYIAPLQGCYQEALPTLARLKRAVLRLETGGRRVGRIEVCCMWVILLCILFVRIFWACGVFWTFENKSLIHFLLLFLAKPVKLLWIHYLSNCYYLKEQVGKYDLVYFELIVRLVDPDIYAFAHVRCKWRLLTYLITVLQQLMTTFRAVFCQLISVCILWTILALFSCFVGRTVSCANTEKRGISKSPHAKLPWERGEHLLCCQRLLFFYLFKAVYVLPLVAPPD